MSITRQTLQDKKQLYSIIHAPRLHTAGPHSPVLCVVWCSSRCPSEGLQGGWQGCTSGRALPGSTCAALQLQEPVLLHLIRCFKRASRATTSALPGLLPAAEVRGEGWGGGGGGKSIEQACCQTCCLKIHNACKQALMHSVAVVVAYCCGKHTVISISSLLGHITLSPGS